MSFTTKKTMEEQTETKTEKETQRKVQKKALEALSLAVTTVVCPIMGSCPPKEVVQQTEVEEFKQEKVEEEEEEPSIEEKIKSLEAYLHEYLIDSGFIQLKKTCLYQKLCYHITFTYYLSIILYFSVASGTFLFTDASQGKEIRDYMGDFNSYTGFDGVFDFLTLIALCSAFSVYMALKSKDEDALKAVQPNLMKTEARLEKLDDQAKVAYFWILCVVKKIGFLARNMHFFIFLVRLYPYIAANHHHGWDLIYFTKSTSLLIILILTEKRSVQFLLAALCVTLIVTYFIRLQMKTAKRIFLKVFSNQNQVDMNEEFVQQNLEAVREVREFIRSTNRVISSMVLIVNTFSVPMIAIGMTSMFMDAEWYLKAATTTILFIYLAIISAGIFTTAWIHPFSQECGRFLGNIYVRMDPSVSVTTRIKIRHEIETISSGYVSYSNGNLGRFTTTTLLELLSNTVQLTLLTFSYFLTPQEILELNPEFDPNK